MTADSAPLAEGLLTRAVAVHGQGDAAQAARLYAEFLRTHPNHPDALHLLGVTETQLGRPQAGLELIARSLRINPEQPGAIANQGNALMALRRWRDALERYEKTLRHWPDYALAHFGRGNALAALGQTLDAVASFDRALALAPRFVEACKARAAALGTLERHADALAAWDQALALAPHLAPAHVGRAAVLLALNRAPQALDGIDHALVLDPRSADAHLERGHILTALAAPAAAIAAFDRALELDPRRAAAWFGRGLALALLGRHEEAAPAFRAVCELDPEHPFAAGAQLHSRLQVCDWTDHAAAVAAVVAAVQAGRRADFPFSFLAICDVPRLQLACARRFADLQRVRSEPLWTGERYAHERIRVAYLSADFLDHPTAYLLAGVLERHDRRRFEIHALSLREDPASAMARRIRAGVEHFTVAPAASDAELARWLRVREFDVVVDLMGYTGEHRAAILAHRPAPVQVNYLGFPATSGSSSHDYILADPFLIPAGSRADYAEQVVVLPDCFQANDARREIAAAVPTRAQAGLPEQGFVWCCLHSSYKINPPLFEVWLRLLEQTPDSVLWVLGGKPAIERNLRSAATARGVDARRLIFAQGLPYAAHLARLRLADLCLDTLPFNGGTSTSDALWAGVPVLTCAGHSFAARMSGSLLNAVGLGELVTGSLDDYHALARRLAHEPHTLARLRDTLAHNRTRAPLFDTDRFRRHLEAAYATMAERSRRGLPPASFAVDPVE